MTTSGPTAASDAPPEGRVVLLGASNLALGISTVAGIARQVVPGPVEFLVAMGHGRSYVARTTVLSRELPSLAECGLWEALSVDRKTPTWALVTDVGNDLFYEFPVDEILRSVEAVLARLCAAEARISLTLLPPTGSQGATWRHQLLRRLFFSRCRLGMDELFRRAEALEAGLQLLGKRYSTAVVAPRAEWYGFDPIHIRITRWRGAWREILSEWSTSEKKFRAPFFHPLRWWRLNSRVPLERKILGIEQRQAQPSWVGPDGTAFSFF